MKRLAFLLCLIPLTTLAARERPSEARGKLGPGTHEFKLMAAGHEWHVRIHVPPKYDPARPTPVVLVLHGAGGNGGAYLSNCGWAKKADQAGFIVVAPDGLPARPGEEPNFLTNPRLWNTGQLLPTGQRARIDDLAFFKALLAEVEQRCNVDKKRVYLTGHSNGAGMTFRLGTELSERFAALAPVASHCWIKDPKPARLLPTLYIIGTDDPLVPLKGGESTLPWGKRTTPPVLDTLTLWAKVQGCPAEPREVSDKDGVKIVEYGPGKNQVKLTVYYISGQGHGWPGGKAVLPARWMGPSVNKVNATDVIWEFFEKSTAK